MQIGNQTFLTDRKVYIKEVSSVAGLKEKEGPLGEMFDVFVPDDMAGKDTWEKAESRLIEIAMDKLMDKAGITGEEVRYVFGGDLLGQLIATSFGLMRYKIPMFGVYGACSTFGEALSLGTMAVSAGAADKCIAIASSHFASAEKQFRFPLEYGNQRPESSTWTVTGCGAVLLTDEPSDICVRGFTTGRIVDYGVKDSMNMGACMAPAAADLIYNNLKDIGEGAGYYDKIITGDLGKIGADILYSLLLEKGIDIHKNYMDCGMQIYDPDTQNTKAGGSGCGCSAITFCGYIYKLMKKNYWRRVLLVPTGALLSTVSYNEGLSVPGIAHGVMLECA